MPLLLLYCTSNATSNNSTLTCTVETVIVLINTLSCRYFSYTFIVQVLKPHVLNAELALGTYVCM